MSGHILWTLCLDCWLSDISSQNELVWEKVIAILNMSLQYIQQHHWQSRLQGYLYSIKNKICIWKKYNALLKSTQWHDLAPLKWEHSIKQSWFQTVHILALYLSASYLPQFSISHSGGAICKYLFAAAGTFLQRMHRRWFFCIDKANVHTAYSQYQSLGSGDAVPFIHEYLSVSP